MSRRPTTWFHGSCSALLLCLTTCLLILPVAAGDPERLTLLLLGDRGHHRPAEFARTLTPVFEKAGIDVTYTDKVEDLTPANLGRYHALAIFRDSGDLPAKEEAALLDFIESGKGLVAIHCASHCFRNSSKYTALVGGRFLRHGVENFRARIIDAQHPAMRGVKSFDTRDETYIHDQLADDIRVLMVRPEHGGSEPYTWVRQQGKGRVYYTALGHDENTWKNEGFHRLLIQGVRWSAGREGPRSDVKPFEYREANVPNYVPSKQWGAMGEPIRKMQLPLSPAESMKHMHLPEGFEVQLYAAEPDIAGKPIAMAWDERGRLWLAVTVDYPNEMQTAGKGRDRILICEDTDRDGKADKFTLFADKLSIPTSLTFARGGLVVAQAPDMLFLKSTKGDDRADVRETLFTGWGTHDTHAGPSNLRRGFDNWIWGTVGYSGFRGKVGGKEHTFGQGVFRFKLPSPLTPLPRGERGEGVQMEFLGSTSNNTWGLGLSEAGDVFGSTANNQHSFYLGLPNRAFEGVRGWYGQGIIGINDHKKIHPITDHVRQVDWHGGFTAAAGHALYTARSFPPEYQNQAAFVCEPTGHVIHVNRLVQQGSSFVARDGWNLLASDDEWTAPIMAEVGPDGALWVIDWYNFIVQHNPTPTGFKTGKGGAYETPLRDKTHARIYRIVYTGAKPTTQPDLGKADVRTLVQTLGHDNLFWRQTAQRLLVDQNAEGALPLLEATIREGKSFQAAIHALWTLHGLGAIKSELVENALKSTSTDVRRAAVAVLPRTAESVQLLLASGCLKSDAPLLRRDAMLALAEMPGSKDAAAAIAAMLQETRNAIDRFIPGAAIAAAARNDLEFLAALGSIKTTAENEKALTEAARVVAGHLARSAPAEAAPRLLEVLGQTAPNLTEAILGGVAAGWPEKKPVTLDAAGEEHLARLPGRLSPGGLLQLAGLVQRWGQQGKLGKLTEGLKSALRTRLADARLGDEARLSAARDLLNLVADADSADAILEQITPQAAPNLVRGLLDVVGQSTADPVGSALIQRWPSLTPAARSTTLGLLPRRLAWTRDLLTALEKKTIERGDLSVEVTQLLLRHPAAEISERAAKVFAAGGVVLNADRKKVVDALLPVAERKGDAVKGRKVFETNCAKCHRHGSLGQSVGPDLTGIAVRDRKDVLIDILDPNRSVEGNYRQYNVETKKGAMLAGLLVAETRTAVELLDSEARKHVVLREDIETITSSKLSLMPEGFEKLGADDLTALLGFLSARDKFVPLPLGKAATIASVKGMFISKESDVERLVFPTWGAQTFAGVPFQVIDPRDGAIPNMVLLFGPRGPVCKAMPKSVSVPCNMPAKAIHLLSGVGGWAFPIGEKGSVSLIVRLHYADKQTEEIPLRNGIHFADYIRVVDVPESRLAFKLRGQQMRYLKIEPKRGEKIERIEFVKGPDDTAPVVAAVTVEGLE